MRRFSGAANTWLVICILPILVIAMLALLDYLRYQQQKDRLEQVARYAVEWSVFAGQGDLYENFGIRSVIPERVENVLSAELYSQLSKDELDSGTVTALKLVDFQSTLIEPQTIKELILQRQYFGFAVDGAQKIIDALDLVEKLKSSIAALTKTLKIIEQVDTMTQKAQRLATEYLRASERLPDRAAQRLAELATSIFQAQERVRAFREGLNQVEMTLGSNQATEEQRQQAMKRRSEHQQALETLQQDLLSWRTRLVEYRQATTAIKEVLESATSLVSALDVVAKEIQAGELVDSIEDGALKETLQPIAGLWDSSGKVISLIKGTVEALVPRASKWIECFEKDIDALMVISEPFITPSGELIEKPLVLLTVEQIPEWAEMNFGEAVLAFAGDKLPLKNPEAFKEWLKAQTLSIMTTASRLYGKDIPVDTFRLLPSQVTSDAESAVQGVREAQGMGGFKGVIEATGFWQSFKSHLNGIGTGILERAIIHDYVLNYFTYNVPSDFEESRQLGEIEYLLIGSRFGLVNSAATDGQIGLLRVGLNAVALLITKQQTLQTISTQLAAVTGGISYPVVYGIVLGGWTIAESATDLIALHRGDAVALCKFDGEFNMDLENVLEKIAFNEKSTLNENNTTSESNASSESDAASDNQSKGQIEDAKNAPTKDSKGQKSVKSTVLEKLTIKWCYEDYLGLLLFTIPEERLLLRIADQWQLDSTFDLRLHFSQLHFEASQPFKGILFRGGTIRCPIEYQVFKGAVAY